MTATDQRAAVRIRAQGLRKAFGGVEALKDAHLEVREGEIHALVGENGAGKSTLLKAMAGAVSPDAGTIVMEGEELPTLTPALSLAHGIAIVPQEIAFVPRMRVAESMALRSNSYLSRGGLVNWKALNTWAQRLLDEWELGIDARARMSTLTPAQHIAVSVVGALHLDARVIILDEPTASFSPPETEHLHAVARRLRAEGRSVVYVTHRLSEVLELCDHVTVMRDGRTVGSQPIAGTTRADLVEMIVGHPLAEQPEVAPLPKLGPVVLEASDLARGRVGPVSFDLRAGEILGFAGLVGAGRTELFRMVFGLDKPEAGTLRLDGREVRIASPTAAVRHGMALVPEERRAAGLVLKLSVRENAVLTSLGRYSRRVTRVLRRRRQRADVERLTQRVRLRAPSIEVPVGHLSGGNQQKVVIARCLGAGSRLLIFDEPTRGVDVGAKEEIFTLVREAAEEGAAVIVASSETEDLVGLCHRVIVLKEGSVVSELTGDGIEARNIARLCFGPR
jgi:ribose transport system ATP-binding protein